VRDRVMQRPGVIEIMKKTGIKKYNKVKSKIMRINLLGNNNDKKINYYTSNFYLM
jgi:aspartate aminotransferase-like enzyme